jgi:putative aldouronate transport system permease protein
MRGRTRLTRSLILDQTFNLFNMTLMVTLAFVTLYPFYNILVTSLNDPNDAARGGIFFFPRVFSLSNYVIVFSDNDILRAFMVTASRTVIGTVCSVLFTAAFAYGISKSDLVGRKLFIGMMLVTMYFSGGLIPYYMLIRFLGLKGSFLVYIIPQLFNAFNAVIMLTFFRSISKELEESARIDGANDLRIFAGIVLPLSTPVLATIALYNGVAQWNSWFDAMLFGGRSLMTLQQVLVNIIQANQNISFIALEKGFRPVTSESLKLATMVITTLPIVFSYPFLQRYFVKGLMLGSLKG